MATVFTTAGDVKPDKLWDRQCSAQRKWQIELAKLLTSTAPQLKELIEIQRDLQLLSLDIRDVKYNYLLRNDPGRITCARDPSEWINFPWSEEDDTRLRVSSPEYAKLEVAKQALHERNQGHASWPELRKLFSTRVQESEEYQALRKALQEELAQIAHVLRERQEDNTAKTP